MSDDILQDRDRLAECFRLLDGLRESGSTDVLDAASYLFGIDQETAKAVHAAWSTTFDREHSPEWRAEKYIASRLLDHGSRSESCR
jgi:hypothetical protein